MIANEAMDALAWELLCVVRSESTNAYFGQEKE